MDSLHTDHKAPTSAVSAEANEIFDNAVSNIPERYRGTMADQKDMSILGKKQVLRVGV